MTEKILNNAYILTSLLNGKFFKGYIKIDEEKGKVIEIGEKIQQSNNVKIEDMNEKIIIPGLVVGHHHLYSALARGMDAPKQTPSNFVETLEYIWWVLDRALDKQSVYYSTMAGLIGAAKVGITGIIDHHASPNFIEGSLSTMEDAFQKVSMRGLLCYEITDRNKVGEGIEGLNENKRFSIEHKNNTMIKGVVGGHASFTIDEKTMDKIADFCISNKVPFHIHLLEDSADRTISIDKYGMEPVSRLEIRHLINEQSILVHGVHLDKHDLDLIANSKATMVSNPRSNMNNRVGRSNPRIGNWALGTDGIDSDILTETRVAFFRGREDNPPLEFMRPIEMLYESQKLLERNLGVTLSEIKQGSEADFTVLNYSSPTPLSENNFAGHLIFGLSSWAINSTMVKGKWILKNGNILTVDEKEEMSKARENAQKLYKKMSEL